MWTPRFEENKHRFESISFGSGLQRSVASCWFNEEGRHVDALNMMRLNYTNDSVTISNVDPRASLQEPSTARLYLPRKNDE